MLKAIGLPMPKTIFAHGWWLTGNAKMSKSAGNVVDPMAMIDKAGVDAFRYFLLSEMSPGSDANFSEESFISRYNSDLANDLGNLLSRVSKMILRSGGVIPEAGELQDIDSELLEAAKNAVSVMAENLIQYKPDQGIDAAMGVIRAGNRYLEKCAPWQLAKSGDTARLATVLYCSAEALRHVAVLLEPVMPQKMAELAKVLGYADGVICPISELAEKPSDLAGRTVSDTAALFPRILVEEEKAAPAAKPEKKKEKKAEKAPEEVSLISIDDFFKSKLKTAKIVAAERVPDAKKLLKLQLEVGSEKRQIVSGIAESYAPEDIIGKTIVIVSNLQPATIRGVESAGMLLAAGKGDKIRLVTLDGDVPSGIDVG
jgi:methionyl-tRNA synthetase